MKKIIELQGAVKLKVSVKSRIVSFSNTRDAKEADIEDARREFRKISNVSNYASFFGMSSERNGQGSGSDILKYKKFT